MKRTLRIALVASVTALAAGACTGDLGEGEGPVVLPPTEDENPDDKKPEDVEKTILDERVIDYNEAFRTASIKLVDVSPTLEQIKRIEQAGDKRATYEEMIDELFADPRFQARMIRWWRDTFRQGGGAFDTAPVFAARIMVEGRPYGELFTATENTCPTYDGEQGIFVDGSCDNGVPVHAGVLTNPGTMAQFYANMGFRRVRWVQEVFACSKFPAEFADTIDETVEEGQYTSPWPFESIATEPIDFQDTQAVICANCHTTLNHLAPLFANFDANGDLQETPQVFTPIAPDPIPSELSHWLVEGETTAWRHGVEVADLPELGQVLANDPEVAACLTSRLWNFTMSKEDIVSDLATVPYEVVERFVIQLEDSGDMRAVLADMFKSEDFVSF